MAFADYIRGKRETKRVADRSFSLRQVAQRIGVEPAYLSKIERGDFAPPSEEKIRLLAEELGEDGDVLLAMAGKVSKDLQAIIRARPATLRGTDTPTQGFARRCRPAPGARGPRRRLVTTNQRDWL
jgi:transcriptional regulator with XRE-family HTH domain